MKKLKYLFLILVAVLLMSCTDNQRAKKFGGTMKYTISAEEKLVNATWKDGDLWVLTRKRTPGEKPETYWFREESNFGVMEGTVIITEQ